MAQGFDEAEWGYEVLGWAPGKEKVLEKVSPNQLTVLRMAFVPILVLLIVYQYNGLALIVFVTAGLTDMLDGLIARKYGRKTHLGTFLDPLADKLLLVSAFTILSFSSLDLTVRVPLWLTITVISRDVLLVLSVLLINLTIGRRAFPPSILGKCTTVFQLGLVMVVLLSNHLRTELPGFEVLTYLTLALTVTSGIHYMLQGMRLMGIEVEDDGQF
jgi:cardiolipin synthase